MGKKWYERPEPIPAEQIREEVTADVVVVGLGYAGAAALRAAAEAGARVVGLEQQEQEKFRSFGRDIGHINSRFLASRGVPAVDPLDLFNELMLRAGNRADPTLVMKFVQNCGAAFDWFTDRYGVEGLADVHVAYWPTGAERFKAEPGKRYNGYRFWNGTAQFPDRMGWPGGPTLPELLLSKIQAAQASGAQGRFGASAVDVILDGRQVRGVCARQADGSYARFLARKGVILAAGDFAGDPEMFADLVTDMSDLFRPGQAQSFGMGQKGMGIRLGVWAGGRLEPRPIATMGSNTATIPGVSTFGILWLDRNGQRFCNEIFGGPEFAGFPASQMPQGTYYNIFDEHILDDLEWAFPAHQGFDASNPKAVENLRAAMDRARETPQDGTRNCEPILSGICFSYLADNLYSGETPEELTQNAGIEGELAEHIAGSIRRYNELCAAGRDTDFGKEPCLLRPLEGTLFLQKADMRGLTRPMTTIGGLVTDGTQNVLDQDYEPIPGLYATGNCCGRRFGPQYSTPIAGLSIGFAITLGREVGRDTAHL